MKRIESKNLISVIIPAFNADEFLAEAIESVLQQAYAPLELIVVNDGSTDQTARVIQSFGRKVRSFYQENQGAPVARNKGILEARGAWLAFLDADDLWHPQKITTQLKCFEEKPHLEIVLGKLQRIFLPGGTQDKKFVSLPEEWMALSLGSGLFRKRVFEKVGLLDETQQYGDDIDWFLRAREKNIPLEVLEQVVLYYRRHGKNMTLQEDQDRRYLLLALKKALDRKRAKPVKKDINHFQNLPFS